MYNPYVILEIKEMEKNTEIEKPTHGKVVIGEHIWG